LRPHRRKARPCCQAATKDRVSWLVKADGAETAAAFCPAGFAPYALRIGDYLAEKT
jgi:hypothetical protein